MPLESIDNVTLSRIPTVGEVRALFKALGVELPAAYKEVDVDQITSLALGQADPYLGKD